MYHSKVNLNKNDGVIVYIKNGVNHLVDEPILLDCSCLTIKINTDTIILGIYRSPSNSNIFNFLQSLDQILHECSSFKNIIIMGDINIDIQPLNISKETNDYLDMLACHGILAAHTAITRGTRSIDHAMVKTKNPVITLIINAPITDHMAVLLCINLDHNVTKANTYSINRINYQNIVKDINTTDFTSILLSDDASWSAEQLILILSHYITSNMIKMVVPRRSRNIKPWITPGLIRCMRKRDHMHLKLKKSVNDVQLKSIYCNYKNVCNDLLKRLKRVHEQAELKKHSNNPKKMWKTIKEITNMSTAKISSDELLRVKPSPLDAVEQVNHYFANVGHNLASNINKTSVLSGQVNHSNPPSNSMVLLPTDENEVGSILNSLHDDCAVGWDTISAKVLKMARSSLIPVLTHIFNLCLSSGTFPEVFKRSVIHPIYKSGERDCVSNYRPISVLTATSKILEKIISKRLLSFIAKENVISKNQFGFRPKLSTEDAVTSLTDYLAQHIALKHKCIGVFLDLAKAFDTVSIPDLLNKMEGIGVRGVALDLFKDYLSNRTQRVKIADHFSSDREVTFGVPQGSVLGPTLFIIYINDLCDIPLENGKVFTYADDTALIFHGDSWEGAKAFAERGLGKIMDWLSNNILTLNVAKTMFLTFAINKGQLPQSEFFSVKAHTCNNSYLRNHYCQCSNLNRTTTIKYLGILLDETLTWKPHITATSNRIRKLIYVFKTLRHVADFDIVKTVYFSLAQSVITYCIAAWGGAAKTHIIQLERAQRSLLKVSKFKPYRYSTEALYSECDVLSVRKLFVKASILRQHSQLIFDINITSRRRNNICQPPKSSKFFIRNYQCYLGPTLYNKLNNTLGFYECNYVKCKKIVTLWLKTLSYDDIEKLFITIR